jgi:hypothetical protein
MTSDSRTARHLGVYPPRQEGTTPSVDFFLSPLCPLF